MAVLLLLMAIDDKYPFFPTRTGECTPFGLQEKVRGSLYKNICKYFARISHKVPVFRWGTTNTICISVCPSVRPNVSLMGYVNINFSVVFYTTKKTSGSQSVRHIVCGFLSFANFIRNPTNRLSFTSLRCFFCCRFVNDIWRRFHFLTSKNNLNKN